MSGQPRPAMCSADELRALFLFEKLTDSQLAWLCREGRVETYPPGPVPITTTSNVWVAIVLDE